MNFMEKLQAWMEKHMLPVANKIAQQKYLKAISAGMICMMPTALVGSIALILMSPPIDPSTLDAGILCTIMSGWQAVSTALFNPLYHIYAITNTMSAMVAVIGISWTLARNYDMEEKEGIIPTSLSMVLFLITAAFTTDGELTFESLGGTGYFAAILMAIIGVESYRFVMKHNIGIIDISGPMVPPAITASFRGMIPGSLIVGVVALANWALNALAGTTLPNIMGLIMAPLVKAIDNPIGLAFFALLVGVFWWFGIHDTAITGPLGVLWTPMALANAAAHVDGVAGTALPYIVTSDFWWAFLTIGGSGATLALAICCVAFAKSKHLKTVGKLGIVPSIFNINEPIIFGMPMMLNPTMFIPFVLAMPVNGLITYFMMKLGVIGRFFASTSWNLPTPFQAMLGTTDAKAMLLNIALILLDMVIYYPFFKMYDKQKLEEEANTAQQA